MPRINVLKQHKLLLDTHVWIWMAMGDPVVTLAMRQAIERAKECDHLLISPISIWEISMLAERKRITLEMDVTDWIKQWVDLPGISLATFSLQVAILSNRLPGTIHGDPAGRILIASAYEYGAVLVSADEKILRFGEGAFISVCDPTAK